MAEYHCGDCVHFRRHYIRYKSGRYRPIQSGHCVFPRLKPRSAKKEACPHFKAAEAETNEA